jgi:pimeloyl-ACP methyl ester carboxylesterase
VDGTIHLAIRGTGRPLVLLPPAPHTGDFFDAVLPYLNEFGLIAVDYPGYGGSASIQAPSIEAYADAIAPHLPKKAILIGFHTGNLVAAELSKRVSVRGIVMIDVPYFDLKTRKAYAKKLDRNPRSAAFQAAFAYDPAKGLADLPCTVTIIATQSSLLDLTRQAALETGWPLIERIDVCAPAFEKHPKIMADTIRSAITDWA